MTTLEIIQELASPLMSIIAILISCFKKRVVKQTKTLDQIKEEANAKNQKFIQKECKKNNIKIEKE